MTAETWEGYPLARFSVDGHACLAAAPAGSPAPERPWAWRTEFFGAFPAVDLALLAAGWHVLYCRLSDRYGCPSAVADMKRFHDEAVTRFGLCPRASLFGFSRGGLYAVNYALAHPQDVESLYLDAPVLDICSWPGGFGAGCGGEREWAECLACYHLAENPGSGWPGNPLNHARDLALLGIPVALVAGDSDHVVPYAENGEPFARAFSQAGGKLLSIVKPGCDHHPHSLADPAPVAEFLVRQHQQKGPYPHG